MPDWGHLDTVVNEAMADFHIMGLGLAVVDRQGLLYSNGFGYADFDSQTPMTPDTGHKIASVTKTMVALMIMKAVEAGQLALDDLATDHLSGLKFKGPDGGSHPGPTLRPLLTHTSGIGEAPGRDSLGQCFDQLFKPGEGRIDIIADFPDGYHLEREPGERWYYCNHGFEILGRILEQLHDRPLADLMQEQIFTPLGMANSHLNDLPEDHLSTPYHMVPSGGLTAYYNSHDCSGGPDQAIDGHNVPGIYNYAGLLGAAGVTSTVSDMALYAQALLNDGGGIVSPQTFNAMGAIQYANHPDLPSMALGFFRAPFGPRDGQVWSLGHTGSYVGDWSSAFYLFPDLDRAVIIHMNWGMLDQPPIQRILHAALDIEPTNPATNSAISEDQLKKLVGRYDLPTDKPLTSLRPLINHGNVEVTLEDGHLMLQSDIGAAKTPRRLLPLRQDDQGFVFLLDTDEKVKPRLAFVPDGADRWALAYFDFVKLARSG